MIILDDEGVEHNCIHPLEKSIAEKITGKSFGVLSINIYSTCNPYLLLVA